MFGFKFNSRFMSYMSSW